MTHIRYIVPFSVGFLVFVGLFVGCTPQNRPPGLPPLSPCVIIRLGDDNFPPTEKVFSLIDLVHTKADTSQLTMTVEKKKNKKSFDIGPPVRILTATIGVRK